VTQDQVLLATLGILILSNAVLVGSIPFRTRRIRRSAREVGVPPGSPAGAGGSVESGAAEDARAIAAIEAFVSGASSDAPGRAGPPVPSEVNGRGEGASIGATAEATTGARVTRAGVPDPAGWSRTIREESARVARFGHPVTVVMAELPHLDVLGDHFGRGVADRVAEETTRLLVSDTREADRIARLGDGRFGVLLLETEEIAAGRYVERVRAITDRWLESTGLTMRLSLGWASPADGGDVVGAAAAAEQRMREADRSSTPER
jgi:diguanylate cyclase (GGDEF)-like protein